MTVTIEQKIDLCKSLLLILDEGLITIESQYPELIPDYFQIESQAQRELDNILDRQ